MKKLSTVVGATAVAFGTLVATALPSSALTQAWAHGSFNPDTDVARICDDSTSQYQIAKIEWLTGSDRNYHSLGANGGCNSLDNAYVKGAIIRWRICAGVRDTGEWAYSCTPYQLTYSTS